NPNNVYELFAKNGDGANEQGLATKVRESLRDANRSITNRAGSFGSGNDSFTLGRNLKEMDKQIERFQERMETIESRYWKQFTAMEQAMQRANAQASQLMNALGGGMM
ncbi:MAG TPA: flagellar filament capping protein FliD, partial [Sporosarcina sp.]|nr:flagellar filament capping protein FliD [Sporosarcina sp.]